MINKCNMNLIGVSGKKQSGKDTFWKCALIHGWDYENKSFATNVKKVCSIITGLPIRHFTNHFFDKFRCENKSLREIMQFVGTDLFRMQYNKNVWINSLFSDFTDKSKWIITDVRFINEAEKIKQLGGILIRINRPTINNDNHQSETELDNYDNWDYVIENNETFNDFEDKIIEIMNKLDKREVLCIEQ